MEHHSIPVNATLQALAARAADVWTLDVCGVTRSQTPIPALVHRDAYAPTTPRTRVLLVGGLSGRLEDVTLAYNVLEAYVEAGQRLGQTLALSAVPCGNPDGLVLGVGPENGAGGRPENGYPPLEQFFYDPHNPERRYLWRWAGLQAPDLLLEVRAGQAVAWEASATAMTLAPALHATLVTPPDSFLAALGADLSNGLTPNGLGPIPGLRLTTPPEALGAQLNRLWSLLPRTATLHLTSPAPARGPPGALTAPDRSQPGHGVWAHPGASGLYAGHGDQRSASPVPSGSHLRRPGTRYCAPGRTVCLWGGADV